MHINYVSASHAGEAGIVFSGICVCVFVCVCVCLSVSLSFCTKIEKLLIRN